MKATNLNLEIGKLQNLSTDSEDEKALNYVIKQIKNIENEDNNSLSPTLRGDGNGRTRLRRQQLALGDEVAESRSTVCPLPRAN